jgi:hypothetical protein
VTILEIGLIVSLTVTLFLLGVSVYFNIKHGILILRFVEGIEETLDILDKKYTSMSEILEIPLFYDSPQIRGVLDDIKDSRDAILIAANQLGRIEDFEIEEME